MPSALAIKRASVDFVPLDLDEVPANTTGDALWFWQVVGAYMLQRGGLCALDRVALTAAALAYQCRNESDEMAAAFRAWLKELALTEKIVLDLAATRTEAD